jgi:hypothetical protein
MLLPKEVLKGLAAGFSFSRIVVEESSRMATLPAFIVRKSSRTAFGVRESFRTAHHCRRKLWKGLTVAFPLCTSLPKKALERLSCRLPCRMRTEGVNRQDFLSDSRSASGDALFGYCKV